MTLISVTVPDDEHRVKLQLQGVTAGFDPINTSDGSIASSYYNLIPNDPFGTLLTASVVGNDRIEVNGLSGTYYRMTIYSVNSDVIYREADFEIIGATFDLDTATPLLEAPIPGVVSLPNTPVYATIAFVNTQVNVETARAESSESLLQPLSQKGQTNGYASLDGTGKVPAGQLPVGGSNTLAGDGDVSISSPANADVLTYNSSSGKWVNLQPSSAVSSVAGKVGVVLLVESDIANLVSDLAAKAPIASPTFTGSPTAPTAAPGNSTTLIATTNFVTTAVSGVSIPVASVFGRTGAVLAVSGDYTVSQITGAAPLASPTFTGTPAAPTPLTADNSTTLSTTAFVKAQGYITSSAVTTVFGRAGVVVATSGDYTVSQITGAAPLASPALSGTPTSPTPVATDNSTTIPTTAFVNALAGYTTLSEAGSPTTPSPLFSPSEAPTSLNPAMWVQDASGNWHVQAGIDTTTSASNLAGVLTFTRKMYMRDTMASTQSGKNAMTSLNHSAGVGVLSSNQDRGMWIGMGNTSGTIRSFSITSNQVTFVVDTLIANHTPQAAFLPGMLIQPTGLSVGTYLNNQQLTILTVTGVGTSTNTIKAQFTNPDVVSTLDTGQLDQAMHSMACLQMELDVVGTPSIATPVLSPDAEYRTASFQCSDAHTGAAAGTNNGVGCIRAQYFRESGSGSWGSTYPSVAKFIVSNNSTVTGGGMPLTGVEILINGLANQTGIAAVGINIGAPTVPFPSYNYGLLIGDYGTGFNSSTDYAVYVTGGQSRFGGNVNVVGALSVGTWPTQSANTILSGPATGIPAAASFRALVANDYVTMIGDSGSGGVKGAVPAPASGDAGANKFLSAAGVWAIPSVPASSVAWDAITSPASSLVLGLSTWSTTFNHTSSAPIWTWANVTAATAGANQSAPTFAFKSNYWNGSTSLTDQWTLEQYIGGSSDTSISGGVLAANITNIVVAANVATITIGTIYSPFPTGATVVISGLTNSALNGTWTVNAAATTTSFKFNIVTSNISSVADTGYAVVYVKPSSLLKLEHLINDIPSAGYGTSGLVLPSLVMPSATPQLLPIQFDNSLLGLVGTITNIQVTGKLATITGTFTNLSANFTGMSVTISGLTNSALNGTWTILGTPAPNATTLGFAINHADIVSTADSGTATFSGAGTNQTLGIGGMAGQLYMFVGAGTAGINIFKSQGAGATGAFTQAGTLTTSAQGIQLSGSSTSGTVGLNGPSGWSSIASPAIAIGNSGTIGVAATSGTLTLINLAGGSVFSGAQFAPTSGVTKYVAVNVVPTINQTILSVSITSVTFTTTTATVTCTSSTGLVSGATITISGLAAANNLQLNGVWTIATVPNGTTFTVTSAFTAHTATSDTGTGAQQATGNYVALLVNPTETAVGASTGNMLLELQVGGTRKWGVDNHGHRVTGAANNDNAGVLSFSGSTTATKTFAVAYGSTPVVIITPVTPGSTTFTLSATSASAFTVTASGTFTGSVNYIVIGNPN